MMEQDLNTYVPYGYGGWPLTSTFSTLIEMWFTAMGDGG